MSKFLAYVWICLLVCTLGAAAQNSPATTEGDYVAQNFHFRSGEVLPSLRLHYTTFGTPKRDASGRVTNAVMVLHETTGSGKQFVSPQFAGVLFGQGQLLDAARYYIILPDGIGHGKSSKPSDGLHAGFPHYDYDDMVAAQHQMLVDGLKVNHLRLIVGTSMGCMHAWVWGETYPDFMDAMMPLACLPVQIAGRNRMMRKMAMDAIREDPAWENGEYKSPPPGLKTALDVLLVMGSSPLQMQKQYPTRDAADAFLDNFIRTRFAATDANDFLYAFRCLAHLRSIAQSGEGSCARDGYQLRRRFHQSAGTRDHGSPNQTCSQRQIRATVDYRSDSRAWNAYASSDLEGLSTGIASPVAALIHRYATMYDSHNKA
jgi:homoserine O-acetyltransferase